MKIINILLIAACFASFNVFAQTQVFYDSYDTASKWQFLENSSDSVTSTPGTTTNPSINSGAAVIASNTNGSYGQEARIFQKISSISNSGIIGSTDWETNFTFKKLTSSSGIINSLSLLIIGDTARGGQYRNGSSVGFNNFDCIGVELLGDGKIQLYTIKSKSTGSPTFQSSSGGTSITNNLNYYGTISRNDTTLKLEIFSNSSRTGTPVVTQSLSLVSNFGANLNYVVHAQAAGWGSSTSTFSASMEEVEVINNAKNANSIVYPETLNNAFTFDLYPNPSDGNSLTVSSKLDNTISIFDLNGKIILKDKLTTSLQTIDITQLQTGTYVMICSDGITFITQKFIKL